VEDFIFELVYKIKRRTKSNNFETYNFSSALLLSTQLKFSNFSSLKKYGKRVPLWSGSPHCLSLSQEMYYSNHFCLLHRELKYSTAIHVIACPGATLANLGASPVYKPIGPSAFNIRLNASPAFL